MQSETWWDYFDEDPNEMIGREVTGAFGEVLTAHMTRLEWAYIDWVRDNLKFKTYDLFAQVEKLRLPRDGDRHDVYRSVVRQNFLRFEKQGKPRPPWCPPALPHELAELDDIEIRR